ncbi:MAG: heavy-metal-associated domain-containing protein [Gammaproteobacteria bacterium]|nr:heavy-metal-associated domain-containing protein [Gammaproteobacteria bacterium]
MKNTLFSTIVVPAAIALLVSNTPAAETAPTKSGNSAVIAIENMTCASCPYMVTRSLEKINGVTTTTIELEGTTAIVTVDYDPATSKIGDLIGATRAIGFPSTIISSN